VDPVLIKEWRHRGFLCRVYDIGPWWTGYVAVEKGHPYWGLPYDKVEVRVPHGLSFYGGMHTKKVEELDLWWFGFGTMGDTKSTDTNPEKMFAETEHLADQIWEAYQDT